MPGTLEGKIKRQILAVGSAEMRICGEITRSEYGESHPLAVELLARAALAKQTQEPVEPVVITGEEADRIRDHIRDRLAQFDDYAKQADSPEKRLLGRMVVIHPVMEIDAA